MIYGGPSRGALTAAIVHDEVPVDVDSLIDATPKRRGWWDSQEKGLGLTSFIAAAALVLALNGAGFGASEAETPVLQDATHAHALSLRELSFCVGAIASCRHRGASITASYDGRFGTAVDSKGLFTFGLNAGNRRVYVNSAKADNSGDGLSPATAKKDWDVGFALFVGAGFTPGDQFMVAGGAGQIYSDSGATNWLSHSYSSSSSTGMTYPTMIMSYDSTDDTNTAKFGKLTGAKMPVVAFSGSTNSLLLAGDTFTNHYGVQGVELKSAAGGPGGSVLVGGIHDGLVFQNIRWNQCGLGINPSNDGVIQAMRVNVSKSTFIGVWDVGGTGPDGIFIGKMTAYRQEDCQFIHCGWKLAAHRDNSQPNGGAQFFQHGFYYHANASNNIFNRNLCMDNGADGHNYRGTCTVTCAVAIDEPIAITFGGYSNSPDEEPLGHLITLDDFVIVGGAAIQPATFPVYVGFNINDTIAGSYARNGVMAAMGLTGNRYFTAKNANPYIASSTCLIDKVRALNYGGSGSNLGDIGVTASCVTPTIHISNSQLDYAVAAPFTSDGGNSISSSGGLPLAKTRDQLITALGFASKAEWANMMAHRNDIPWAAIVASIMLPAYGLTLTTIPTTTLPSLAGESPSSYYRTSLTDLTLSATFARGSVATAVLVGTGANSSFSATGLPSGVTLLGSQLSFDGSGTGAASGTISVTETSLDGLGSHTSSVPYTIAAGVSGPTLTGAQNYSATTTTASLNVTTNQNSGTLYYVITTSSTAPSAAQIKAGQDQTGASLPAAQKGSQAVSASGAKTFTSGTLTNGVQYYGYFMHENATPAQSAVVSASWLQGIGSNVILNGTFATTSNWSLQGSASISGGVLNCTNSTSIAFQSGITHVLGATYKVDFDVNMTSGARLRIDNSSGVTATTNGGTGTLSTGSQHVTLFFTSSISGSDFFEFQADGGLFTGTIDNVTMVRVG